MRVGLTLMIMANIFNVLDLMTTFYAIYVLGCFKELNVYASMLMNNPVIYAVIKIGSVLVLSFVYVKSSKSEHPFVVGVNRGCVLSFCIMVVVLGSASVLNILQIAGCDVSQVLILVAKAIPTLEVVE